LADRKEIDKKEDLHQSTFKEFQDKNKTYQSVLDEREHQLKELESKMGKLNQRPVEDEESLREWQEKIDELSKKLEDALAKIKEKDEKIKVITGQSRKEKALLEQNLNFHEIQVSELKRQLEENKRLNENALSALEGRGEKRAISKDMEELKADFEAKMEQMVLENEKSRQFLNQKIEQLTEANDELFKEKQSLNLKHEKNSKEMTLRCERLTDDLRAAQDSAKNMESQKLKEINDLTERYKLRIEALESEIDNLKYKNSTEINIFQSKSEDNIKQLRGFFESEKNRLERRLGEEKEKYDKMYGQMKEEYDQR
jgi:chromosome segregation ATPase